MDYGTETLRIPKGLWDDLQEAVIQQDRQFLTFVARKLGLPAAEVLTKCGIRTAERRPIPVLWAPESYTPFAEEESCICPWWECHGEGLWRRCPRFRLSETMPCCAYHERTTPGPRMRINADPVIREMRPAVPVRDFDGELWWVDPDGSQPPFREDGSVDYTKIFRRITRRDGRQVWVQFPATSECLKK